MHSSLTKSVVPANRSNYTQGRKGYKVCKFTPHHMAGVLTGEQCARIFQRAGRQASANYCIGNDGSIVCSVEEENRAWTSSSSWNDCQAITVEVSNSSTGGDWPISDAAWNSLVNLATDVCRRYGFRLSYDGTKNGSLTRHNMYASTNCPGPYLQARLPQLAAEVNARLDGTSSAPAVSIPVSSGAQGGYLVTINTDVLNVRTGPGTNHGISTQVRRGQVYTIVETSGNWGKLKSGAGWICLDYTTSGTKTSQPVKATPAPAAKGYVLGLYTTTASALNVRSGPGTNYKVKKTYKKGTRFDTYEIRGNWARTPSGWVCLDYATLTRKY